MDGDKWARRKKCVPTETGQCYGERVRLAPNELAEVSKKRAVTWCDQPPATFSSAQAAFLRASPDTSITSCRHNQEALASMMSNTGQQHCLSNHCQAYLTYNPLP